MPAQPTGRLNMERALFMTHPINGIDDLIYVAIFGAHAYCVVERDQRRQASGDDVFNAFKVTHLACNHADPTISLGVYDLVYRGAQVALANPLGMYIRRPNLEVFTYDGEPLPEDWVRFSRGKPGSYMRLEFGPPDDHEAFLDDITLSLGASEQPLTGGYQLLRELEIGPLVSVGETDPIADDEWEAARARRGDDRLRRPRLLQGRARPARALRSRARGSHGAAHDAGRRELMALQEGIYHAPGRRPGRHFGLLFLRAAPAAGAAGAAAALTDLWAMYQGLKAGNVRDLEGVVVPRRRHDRPARVRAQRV